MFKTFVEVITLIASFLIQHCLYGKSLPAGFNPRRILVIKLDHLGDVLLATPVFSNLRRAYPSSLSSWITSATYFSPHLCFQI
jgi:hypothetical protein